MATQDKTKQETKEEQTSQQEPTKEPKTTDSDSPKIRETDYVVLRGHSDEGPFWVGGTIHLEKSAGQKEARKRFVQQTPNVQEVLEAGEEEVWLAAVPLRSWAPTQVVIEQPPPRLHI